MEDHLRRARRRAGHVAARLIGTACVLGTFVVGGADCTRPLPEAAAPAAAPDDMLLADDQVGVDDAFEVRVYGEGEMSGTYRVAPDGTIDFPLAGRIKVAGLRIGQIQERVAARLREGYLKNPQVTAMM